MHVPVHCWLSSSGEDFNASNNGEVPLGWTDTPGMLLTARTTASTPGGTAADLRDAFSASDPGGRLPEPGAAC
jgi:hypothetical protein